MTAVNYVGVEKTAGVTKVIVSVVLVTLVILVGAAWASPGFGVSNLTGGNRAGIGGILEAAGLLFFAFAGYARIATLGEEVEDPSRTIPRAIPLALGATLTVYAVVAITSLLAVGPHALATADAPLVAAAEGGSPWAGPVVRVGGTVAALGVLLSLLAGVSRTGFAMARDRHLPAWLDAVHPRHRTPHRAELTVGVLVVLIVAIADLRGAIGFSSFAVLTYYAIANASALTQPDGERRWPRWLQVVGLAGCVLLAFSLPLQAVVGGSILLAIGAALFPLSRR
jgi:APA family basic amino acid/polyamine antiporter